MIFGVMKLIVLMWLNSQKLLLAKCVINIIKMLILLYCDVLYGIQSVRGMFHYWIDIFVVDWIWVIILFNMLDHPGINIHVVGRVGLKYVVWDA
jgi:hypothetical protein